MNDRWCGAASAHKTEIQISKEKSLSLHGDIRYVSRHAFFGKDKNFFSTCEKQREERNNQVKNDEKNLSQALFYFVILLYRHKLSIVSYSMIQFTWVVPYMSAPFTDTFFRFIRAWRKITLVIAILDNGSNVKQQDIKSNAPIYSLFSIEFVKR